MKLILAIDIKSEKVVKAYAGFRLNYNKLFLGNKDFSCPFLLIKTVINKYKIKQIYIADLDALSGKNNNKRLIINILRTFSKIDFLIDLGFSYPIKIFNLNSELENQNLFNFNFILGTETIKNYHMRDFLLKKTFYFSIDFNGTEKEWLNRFYFEKEKLNLIFMFVKQIGGRGINYKVLKGFKKVIKENNSLIAGGVRNVNDLKKLSCIGFDGAIVSTLIHRKMLRDI